MIVIGLGSNLCGDEFSSPRSVLEAALNEMPYHGISVKKVSRFYESEPIPKSDQPWFVNAVAEIESQLSAHDLLHELHAIEAKLGRQRRIRWEARIIDLDIIAYHDHIFPSPERWHHATKDISSKEMIIPHSRMHERLFVLKPLLDINPDWVHPVMGCSAYDLAVVQEKKEAPGIIRAVI